MTQPSSRGHHKLKDAKHKGSPADEEIKKLLTYFGLEEYTGLLPILKKLGSDTTSLSALFVCAVSFVLASGLAPMNPVSPAV